jgi:hypothetical protein
MAKPSRNSVSLVSAMFLLALVEPASWLAIIIPLLQELRPRLPTLVGSVDDLTLRQRWEQLDALSRDSGVEQAFVQCALEDWTRAAPRVAPSAH